MAAYVYALKHGLEYHCPDNTLAPHLWPNYFTHLSNPNWNPNLETVYVNDNKHSYTELPFKEEWRDKNIIIGTTDGATGFFQSYKYLEGYEDKVRIAFGFSDKEIKKEWVGIHWRLGDYLSLPLHHPIVSEKYLSDSIGFIKNSTGAINCFYCCSDGINELKNFACKNYIDEIWKFTFSINQSELKDFTSLMYCENLIVSNSSFSVLAAILNPNKNKVVVCPDESNYFGIKNKHLDISTLYPDNWIRIKY
jgi:hypothetical protein